MVDTQKIDYYFLVNAKYFPEEKIMMMRDRFQFMDENRFMMISSLELKDPMTLLIVSIFLGSLGIDRFMIGDTGMGILKLLTCGGCGIITIIDWFLIQRKTKELNFNKIMTLL